MRGVLHTKFNIETFERGFSKVVFWLKEETLNNPSVFSFELWYDNIHDLDKISTGSLIDVKFRINGRISKKNGRESCWNTLVAIEIKKIANG